MPTNKYGMPNGGYAQRAQAAKAALNDTQGADVSPITTALNKAPGRQGVGPPADPAADPLSSVTRNGLPNLNAAPPPMPTTPQVQPTKSLLNQNPVADGVNPDGSGGIMGAPAGTFSGSGPFSDQLKPAQPPAPVAHTTPTSPLSQQALSNALGAPPTISGRYSNGDSDYTDANTIIGNAYQNYLGRAPEGDVVNQQLHGIGWGGQTNGRVGALGVNGIVNGIYNSPEAQAYRQQIQTPAAPPTTASGNPYAADDPRHAIQDLYDKAGIKDGGAGSGFADMAYWAQHPDQVSNGRLAADLAGTGSDQPTGTPGSGPWQNSGKGQAAASNPQQTALQNALSAPMPSMNGSTTFGNTDYPQQLLQQLMQSLATQNALFKQ